MAPAIADWTRHRHLTHPEPIRFSVQKKRDLCPGHRGTKQSRLALVTRKCWVYEAALFVHMHREAGRAKYRLKNETEAHRDAQLRACLAPDTKRDGG